MIPVFKPIINNSDIKAVLKALKNGEISGTYGKSILKLFFFIRIKKYNFFIKKSRKVGINCFIIFFIN